MARTSLEIKKRTISILTIFFLIIFLLIVRMFWLQFVEAGNLQKLAYEQQTKNRTISPKRGTIYDRNGKILAKSASVETISITPKNIAEENKEKVAKGLSEILSLDYGTILEKTKKNTADEIIAKKLEKDKTDPIRKWINDENIRGVNIYEDTKRYYPNGSFASHVLGFCGTDNQGLDGIEIQYESLLKGVPGKLVVGTDGIGREMPVNNEKYIPPEDGLDLVLTIDEMIQHIVEKYLDQAVIDNKAVEGGVCIVMNPQSGDILAMATVPDYNPNDPFTVVDQEIYSKWDTLTSAEKTSARQAMWRNKAIVDTYEPGSVFKIITSSIAVEEKVIDNVDKEGQFNCTGSVKVDGWKISCWRSYNPHGPQSLRKALMNSCNPVFVNVGLMTGKETYYKYLDAFGITGTTGIDLPGEAKGLFHPVEEVVSIDLATMAFGQGFTITPLNLLNSASAVANGGKLMKPRLVKEIRDQEGNVVQKIEPKVVKQVISEETSNVVLDMMESVVSNGTGRFAQVKGYYIAGKTGTAEQGRGTNKKYVASFLGVAPAKNPEIAIIFNLYSPKGEQGHQGGGICAPVVGNILNEIIKYLEIPQNYEYTDNSNQNTTVPDVRNKTVGEAVKIINNAGFKYSADITDENTLVVGQMPQPGETLSKQSIVKLYLKGNDMGFGVTVPDVKKMDIMTSTKKLSELNLNIKVSGTGMSIFQEPAPGTTVEQGSIVRVEFRPVGLDVE
jgi:stage V sporulation protein D (sporulation-specific penicillin-binding protein)